MRLIDADALQREYMKFHDGKRIVLVDVAPTIEPERKKGKWIVGGKHPKYHLRCSECRKVAMWANGISYIYPNFCPNCGARMEGNDE